MVDLRSWRLPVAVVLLVALTLGVVASLISAVEAALAGGGVVGALAVAGAGLGEVVLAVALAAVCWWAGADGIRGARGLAGLGAALVIVQVLLGALAAVATALLPAGSPAVRAAALVVRLSWLVVPAVSALVLIRVAARPVVEPTGVTADVVDQGTEEIEHAASPAPDALPAAQPYPEPAGWAPDEAAGAVWTSAGAAAAGAAAAAWGSSSADSDWSPDAGRGEGGRPPWSPESPVPPSRAG